MAGGTILGGKGAGDGTTPSVTLEQVMAEVGKTIDAKLSAKFDDFKKTGVADAIKAQVDPVTAQLATINDALAKLVAGGGAGGAGGTGGTGGGAGEGALKTSPEVNAQLRDLTQKLQSQGTEITTLKTAKETAERHAEETDRHSTIRTALTGMPFVNDKAAQTAFGIVLPHVRRLDDGSLVAGIGGDNFPVDAFTKDYLEKEHGYLFKPSGASGSGAPSNGGGVRMGAKVDTSVIKVGMDAKDRAAVVESIAAAMQAQ